MLNPEAYNNLIDKKLIDANQATPGVNYFCPACHNYLRLRNSTQKNLHFYHLNPNVKCNSETYMHKMYKQAIYEKKMFTTPNGDILHFDNVELEKKINDFIPDISAHIGHKTFYIEIEHTSKIDKDKLEKIKKVNNICYSVQAKYIKYDDIKYHLFNSTENKKNVWLGYESYIEQIIKQHTIEIEQYEKIYQDKIKLLNKDTDVIRMMLAEQIEIWTNRNKNK